MAKRNPLASISDLNKESREFLMGLSEETDRGLALAVSAFLDDTLEAMLCNYFVDDQRYVAKSLLDGDAPLAAFSARTKLVYCLGWIGPDTFDDLNLIRKIRNEFAHHRKAPSFEDEPIRDWCRALKACGILGEFFGHLGCRDRFLVSAALHSQRLLGRAATITRVKPGEDPKIVQSVGVG